MTATPKQQREVEAHNRLAQEHYQHLDDDTFHIDPVIQGLLDKAGNLQGLTVLECGCGRGVFTEYLAKQGAHVVAFDISDQMVELARKRVAGQEHVRLLVSPIETLSFDESERFDLIIGLDILHHVDLNTALPKLREWVKPGGQALFVENLGLNPVLVWSRNLLAGRFGVAKYGTDDERPLSRQDIRLMQQHFEQVELYIPQMVFLQVFSRNVLRYQHAKWLQRALEGLDNWLYSIPSLRWLSYKTVVVLK